MVKRHVAVRLILVACIASNMGLAAGMAHADDSDALKRGKYLVMIGGCNDCHTPGYLMSEGKTPENEWLTGDSFGWRGPWGTTYAANLRTLAQGLTEPQWIQMAKNLKARPPMPWFNLNQMTEEDLGAIYKYIRHLGPGGKAAPAYVPPGEEPSTPYALFPPPPPN